MKRMFTDSCLWYLAVLSTVVFVVVMALHLVLHAF
jgi:hypothetical protein